MKYHWDLVDTYDPDAFKREGRRLRLFGKGGGGQAAPAPTTQTVQQNTIAPEAAPYYSTLLGQAAAVTDINNNPWQQYTGQRVAGFSPMQQTAFNDLEGMQLPQQTTDASNMAYQTGNTKFNMPGVAGSYMSPYIQNALNPVMESMQRQSDLRQRDLSGQAQQAGAFGGYRHGLQLAEEQRNTQKNMGDTYAQGMQAAYGAANNSYNADANIGLQGASTLGQLGQQQYSQRLGLNQAQQLAGAQVQDQSQQNLNNQYQDFLGQQNWPYKNIGFMSDIIGRPLTNASTSIYQAPPSTSQSLMGLGLGAYGLSGMLGGKKDGGLVGYKKGGVVKQYNTGGVAGDVSGILSRLPPEQLSKLAQQGKYLPYSAQQMNQNAQITRAAPPSPQVILPPEQGAGVAQLDAGDMQFADGGIVGYADGGLSVADYIKENDAFIRSQAGDRFAKEDDRAIYGNPMLLRQRQAQRDRAKEIAMNTGQSIPAAGVSKLPEWYTGKQAAWDKSPTGLLTLASEAPAPEQLSGPPAVTAKKAVEGSGTKGIAAPAPSGKSEAVRAREAEQQKVEAVAQAQRPEFKMDTPPEVSAPKSAEEMLAEHSRVTALAKESNPMYSEVQKLTDAQARLRAQDPYVAAINAAQAIMGGRGGMKGLEALAVGAGAAGKGQIAREKEHYEGEKEIRQMTMALMQGDQKTATHIQDKLLAQGMKQEELKQKVWETQNEIRGRLEGQGIAADASRYSADSSAAAHRYSADKHLQGVMAAAAQRAQRGGADDIKGFALLQKIHNGIEAQAEAVAKQRTGISDLSTVGADQRAIYDRTRMQIREQLTTQSMPVITRLGKKYGMDADEIAAMTGPPSVGTGLMNAPRSGVVRE